MADQPDTGSAEQVSPGNGDPIAEPDLQESLAAENLRQRQELSELHGMAYWALRAGTSGWALLRGGLLKLTNRAFDALDRKSVVGPGWLSLEPGRWAARDEGQGRTLAEIVVEDARLLDGEGSLMRRSRFTRGEQVVEVTSERAYHDADERQLVIANVRDITELADAEARLAATQARLATEERAARVGQVALGVGHDLGNLLGALSARLMLLEAEGRCSRENLTALQSIAAAQRTLVGRLKDLAWRKESARQSLHLLTDVIDPAVRIIESWLQNSERRRRVQIAVDADLARAPRVLGVRDELVNVVINLLVNAGDAMPDGGRIRIGAEVDAAAARLQVDDEGSGIAADVLGKIFDPFFSTKGSAGTGIGLAMARQAMRGLGGEILASNRPEGGARFELRFPRSSTVSEIEDDHGDPSAAGAT